MGVADNTAKVQIIGHQWARDVHLLKDFLGRNRVPFAWLDLDRGRKGQAILVQRNLESARLPVVLLSGGVVLEDPSVPDLAEAMGMHRHADNRYYDVAIIGAGPAGLAAAVYAASEGLSTLVVEREAPGGQAGTSSRIENYLGFPDGISGGELAAAALQQAKKFGAEVLFPVEATAGVLGPHFKELSLSDGSEITTRAMVIATGVSYRTLHGPGMSQLNGAGVYYGAATTEAASAQNRHVFLVGAGNSAGQGALYFSRFASGVTMFIRGPSLAATMSQYLIDQLDAEPKIEIIPHRRVVAALGDDHLEAIRVENVESGVTEDLPADFLFVFIGAEPDVAWLGDQVMVDERGFVLTGSDIPLDDAGWPLDRSPHYLEASIPGVFAAGDIRHGAIRRVAGGVGEGSTTIQLVHRYLAETE